jgi:hypothetical protein
MYILPKKRMIQFLDALEIVLVLWNSKPHVILMLLLLGGEGGELLLLRPGELGGDQGVVQTLHLHQLIVGPLLNHLPVLRSWGVRGLSYIESKLFFFLQSFEIFFYLWTNFLPVLLWLQTFNSPCGHFFRILKNLINFPRENLLF